MGAVYEVLDETTKGRRALKVMLRDALRDQVQHDRFALEAQITGAIESDHIVRVLDAGVDASTGMPFLTMELLRGGSLRELLRAHGAMPFPEVTRLLRQAALGLSKTHAAGIIHRDLKPDNLFITTRDDGSPCLKILDFGIAKVAAQSHQGSATRIGTPLYMAPEQISGRGSIGAWTDLFALGHIAYELCVGEHYFREESLSSETPLDFYHRILAGILEPPSARALRRANVTLPPGFDEWMGRAVNTQPEGRFSSAMEQVEALVSLLDPNAEPKFSTTGKAPPLSTPRPVLSSNAFSNALSNAPSGQTGPRGIDSGRVDTGSPSVHTLPMESTAPPISQMRASLPASTPLVPTLGLPPLPREKPKTSMPVAFLGLFALFLAGSAAVILGFAAARGNNDPVMGAGPNLPTAVSAQPPTTLDLPTATPTAATTGAASPSPSALVEEDAGTPADAGARPNRPTKRALPSSVDGF